MQRHSIAAGLVAVICVVIIGRTNAADNRAVIKTPDGIAFAEFKGFEAWQTIAPSQTEDGIKSILGNPTMIRAYQSGFPGNGMPVPDGAVMAKVEWSKQPNTTSPYTVAVPNTLKSVAFMIKNAKRFPDTNGWGYAQFVYDASADSFKPVSDTPAVGKTTCHPCHTRVKASDFVFTRYAHR